MKRRIGPKMALVAHYVAQNPGHVKKYYACKVGSRGSLDYGYRTVERAIAAGLVLCKPNPARRGSYILFLPCED